MSNVVMITFDPEHANRVAERDRLTQEIEKQEAELREMYFKFALEFAIMLWVINCSGSHVMGWW